MLKIKNFKNSTIILMISILICTLFTGCSSKNTAPLTSQPTARTITDHAGRAVTIPITIIKSITQVRLGLIHGLYPGP